MSAVKQKSMWFGAASLLLIVLLYAFSGNIFTAIGEF